MSVFLKISLENISNVMQNIKILNQGTIKTRN